jgi:hypothetical protein
MLHEFMRKIHFSPAFCTPLLRLCTHPKSVKSEKYNINEISTTQNPHIIILQNEKM